MAIPQNKIGDFEFVTINGRVEPARTELERIARPGVNGVGLWDMGRRAPEFQLETFVDLATINDVYDTLTQYQDLIDAEPVSITQGGRDLTAALNTEFQVMDVRMVEEYQFGASVGGINGPSAAGMTCVWTLQPIERT